jgi:hypothetical protein
LNSLFALNHRLSPWEEAVGELREIHEEGNYCLAIIGPVTLALPLDMFAQLKDLRGKRVGILRTEQDYRIRDFKLGGEQ